MTSYSDIPDMDKNTTVELGEPVKAVETSNAVHTLGHVRLRDVTTNEIILIPTPSDDPHDPLNWWVLFSRLNLRLLR